MNIMFASVLLVPVWCCCCRCRCHCRCLLLLPPSSHRWWTEICFILAPGFFYCLCSLVVVLYAFKRFFGLFSINNSIFSEKVSRFLLSTKGKTNWKFRDWKTQNTLNLVKDINVGSLSVEFQLQINLFSVREFVQKICSLFHCVSFFLLYSIWYESA